MIRMRMAGPNDAIYLMAGDDAGCRKWLLAAVPSDDDIRGLREELGREPPTGESQAVIETEEAVPNTAVLKVLGAAKEAGYSRIVMTAVRP